MLAAVMQMSIQDWEIGGITFYGGEQFEGKPLKCPGYRYEPETGPWVAVPLSWYESGEVECGDWFLVEFADGGTMMARALDSGYLDAYKVWDSGLSFVADLPTYWRDDRETATGRVLNLTALLRERMN